MDARRRLLLDSLQKTYVFLAGSGEIINGTGENSFNYSTLGSLIEVNAPIVAVVGDSTRREQGYGYFRIRTDFTKFKKLCIEAESRDAGRTVVSAIGYANTYSGSTRNPRLPDVYTTIQSGSGKTVYQFDISNVTGLRNIVGVITSVSSLYNVNNALTIHNIWLE